MFASLYPNVNSFNAVGERILVWRAEITCLRVSSPNAAASVGIKETVFVLASEIEYVNARKPFRGLANW
jgi:hypothetical protein